MNYAPTTWLVINSASGSIVLNGTIPRVLLSTQTGGTRQTPDAIAKMVAAIFCENIRFLTPYVVDRFEAKPGDGLTPLAQAVLKHTDTGEERTIAITGAFIAIGHDPQSELVRGQVDVDEEGYVQVEGVSTQTNRPGVFAAGDLIDSSYRQAITAAGSGCMAALDAERYLRDVPALSDEAATAA